MRKVLSTFIVVLAATSMVTACNAVVDQGDGNAVCGDGTVESIIKDGDAGYTTCICENIEVVQEQVAELADDAPVYCGEGTELTHYEDGVNRFQECVADESCMAESPVELSPAATQSVDALSSSFCQNGSVSGCGWWEWCSWCNCNDGWQGDSCNQQTRYRYRASYSNQCQTQSCWFSFLSNDWCPDWAMACDDSGNSSHFAMCGSTDLVRDEGNISLVTYDGYGYYAAKSTTATQGFVTADNVANAPCHKWSNARGEHWYWDGCSEEVIDCGTTPYCRGDGGNGDYYKAHEMIDGYRLSCSVKSLQEERY
jgi:hypothetical protein